jgi:hypothetical protein
MKRMRRAQFKRVRDWLSEHLAMADAAQPATIPNDFAATSGMTNRRSLVINCVLVFSLALGVRLLYWQDAQAEIARGNSTIQELGRLYRDEARRMIERGGILFPNGPVDPGDARLIAHPPGYAILMAAFARVFGESDAPVRLFQIICAAAQAVIVLLLLGQLLPRGVAVIAGLLVALSPHMAYYSIYLSPDSLAVLPILIAIYFLISALKRPHLMPILAVGVCLGLSCWLRSNALLLAPFMALVVVLVFPRGKRLRYATTLVGAMMIVIAPITIRNWAIYHRFIPISVGAGLNLLEGISEYDKEGNFGLPTLDPDVMIDEAVRHERPDYGGSLYSPDGIERDRERLARGVAVLRTNPGWFAGVMLRRMFFMLRYNDYRFENPKFNAPNAPAVSAAPLFGHPLAIPDALEPAHVITPTDLLGDQAFVAPEANLSLDPANQLVSVTGDGSEAGDQFISAPIAVHPGTDYTLTLEIWYSQGFSSIRVRTADPRFLLAWASVPEVKRKKKAGDTEKTSEIASIDAGSKRLLFFHFATGSFSEIRIAVANDKVIERDRMSSTAPVVEISRAALYDLGATPYQWTRFPRGLIRGVQKNLYKTEWMLPLVVLGACLLAVVRCHRALVILLAVPAYYLIVHSSIHTEYRYILALHGFLFGFAAITLYSGAIAARQLIKHVKFARRKPSR